MSDGCADGGRRSRYQLRDNLLLLTSETTKASLAQAEIVMHGIYTVPAVETRTRRAVIVVDRTVAAGESRVAEALVGTRAVAANAHGGAGAEGLWLGQAAVSHTIDTHKRVAVIIRI